MENNGGREQSLSLPAAPQLHDNTPFYTKLSLQPTTSDLALLIRQSDLETQVADATLFKLKEGIKSIKDLEFIGAIIFHRRRWLKSDIEIVLLNNYIKAIANNCLL